MPVYEVTGAGFDGGTDATDDRVLWVAAGGPIDVEVAIEGLGATFVDVGPIYADVDDIDIDLREPAGKAELRARLRSFLPLPTQAEINNGPHAHLGNIPEDYR